MLQNIESYQTVGFTTEDDFEVPLYWLPDLRILILGVEELGFATSCPGVLGPAGAEQDTQVANALRSQWIQADTEFEDTSLMSDSDFESLVAAIKRLREETGGYWGD